MQRPIIVLLVALLLVAAFATGANPSTRSSADLYQFVQSWGVPGSGPGELARPSGIAVGLWGDRVYIADTYNDRVQVFTSSGVVVDTQSARRPASVTTSVTGHWYTLEAPLRKIVKFVQSLDIAVGSWQVGEAGQLPPSVFDPEPGEIAASGTNGIVYGRGFCSGAGQCDHASDVVTQWDAFAPAHVTGVWDLHVKGELTTALTTDRQGNFYVARAAAVFNDCPPASFNFCYSSGWLEWVEKYGSNGQFVGRSAGATDVKYVTSLAVDPNTGQILMNSGRGIFALSANLKSETETGIPSEAYRKITVDCRSNVWVLSESSGGVSRYAPPRPANSCARRPPTQLVKSILLAPARLKTTGSGGAAVIAPVACAQGCRGSLTAQTAGASPAMIGRARFRLPAGGGAVVIPLNGRGKVLVAGAGTLKISVAATLAGASSQVSVVHSVLKDPSAASLACPRPAQAAGVPFAVEGTVTPANSRPGRVQIAFGRSAIGGRYGYLAARQQLATAIGHGGYRTTLTADVPGVWRIQLVSLGDDAHEASHSVVCTLNVAAASPSPPPPSSAPPTTPPPPPSAVVPTVSIADAAVKEGDSGTDELAFITVSLSGASSQQVQVDYATADGTAMAGSDYQAASGTLSFSPGETSKQISVKVNGDASVEPDEQFSVELSNASGATIADGHAVGTILNDDTAGPPPPPPPPVTKPDLIVASIDGAAAPGEVLSSCAITFTVKNIGTATAEPSTTNVHGHRGIAGNSSANVSTPALAPGQSIQQQGTIAFTCGGTDVIVTADTTAVIDESNEDNNFLGQAF